jgi:hypothetical protein
MTQGLGHKKGERRGGESVEEEFLVLICWRKEDICKAVAEGRSDQEKEGAVYRRSRAIPIHARGEKLRLGKAERVSE